MSAEQAASHKLNNSTIQDRILSLLVIKADGVMSIITGRGNVYLTRDLLWGNSIEEPAHQVQGPSDGPSPFHAHV